MIRGHPAGKSRNNTALLFDFNSLQRLESKTFKNRLHKNLPKQTLMLVTTYRASKPYWPILNTLVEPMPFVQNVENFIHSPNHVTQNCISFFGSQVTKQDCPYLHFGPIRILIAPHNNCAVFSGSKYYIVRSFVLLLCLVFINYHQPLHFTRQPTRTSLHQLTNC